LYIPAITYTGISPTFPLILPDFISPFNSSMPFYIQNAVTFDMHYGMILGFFPAYNAIEARMELLDNWGSLGYVTSSEALPEKGMENGSIAWDGTYRGQVLTSDLYNFSLEFRNCNNTQGKRIKKAEFKCESKIS